MDTTILEDLGLTNAEIKVYLALLELGLTTAGPIIEKTGLQNSVVHMTLHKLLEKGFTTYIKKVNIRHYQPTDPENIVKFIDEKKARFQKLLPLLKIKQKKQEKTEAEVFEGFKGFKNLLAEMIKDTRKGDEYLFFAFYTENSEEFQNVYSYYQDFDKVRKDKGLKTKGIFPRELEQEVKKRKVSTKMVDFPIPTGITIVNNKVLLTPWGKRQTSFLIRSEELAKNFTDYFYSIWNSK